MGIASILVSIFFSAALLWGVLRVFARHEADFSWPRYLVFGVAYCCLGWMGQAAMNSGLWIVMPLAVFTALAICQFFYVTAGKSLWLAAVFVGLRTVFDMAILMALFNLLVVGQGVVVWTG